MDPDNNNTNPMPGNDSATNARPQSTDITIPPVSPEVQPPVAAESTTMTSPTVTTTPESPVYEVPTLETPTADMSTAAGATTSEPESPINVDPTPLADNQPISFGSETSSENTPDQLAKDAISGTPEFGAENSTQPADSQSTEGNATKPAILTEESSTPLTPADPVPGSIGSSTSFGTNQSAKKKLPILPIILLLILLAIVAGGGAGAYYYFNFTNKPTKSSTPTAKVATPEVVSSTLTCNLATKPDQTQNNDASVATKTDHKIIANYEGDRLVEFTDRYEATYATSAAAMTALETAKKDYDALLQGVKLEKDPFTSEATRKDATIIVSHVATMDQITTANAPLLGLATDSKAKVITDYKSLKSNYEARKYTCKYE